MEVSKPKILYKYHKLNDHLFDLIRTSNLWFSHQNGLNDPFDCRYSLSDEYLLSLIKKASSGLLKDLKERRQMFDQINEDRFLEIMLPHLRQSDWMNGLYNMLFGEQLGWSVCCFTTDSKNELMWAHYADSNRGVCLEFDLSGTPLLYDKLFKIDYADEFSRINSMDELKIALFRKRRAWSTEDEWRIVSDKMGPTSFNKESLTGIYFGCNVGIEQINDIRKLLVDNGYRKVNFKQFNFFVDGTKLTPLKEFA